MEQAVYIKNGVLAGLALVGTVVTNALGGWDIPLQVLICFMVLDYITGIVVAAVFKRSGKSDSGALESRAGFKGLVRKLAVLVLVFVSTLLDRVLGAAYVRAAVCFFFVANEALSVLENIGLMGVPYPSFLKNMLQVLREQSGSGKRNKE